MASQQVIVCLFIPLYGTTMAQSQQQPRRLRRKNGHVFVYPIVS